MLHVEQLQFTVTNILEQNILKISKKIKSIVCQSSLIKSDPIRNPGQSRAQLLCLLLLLLFALIRCIPSGFDS